MYDMSSNQNAETDFSVSSIQFIADGISMDDGGYETVSTSAILYYCKMKVLVPYFRLLSLLGWRQLISQNTLFENPLWIKLINLMYTLLILVLILSGYILQYSYCYRQDGYRPYSDISPSNKPCCGSSSAENTPNFITALSQVFGTNTDDDDVNSTNGSNLLTNSTPNYTYTTVAVADKMTVDSFRKRPRRQSGSNNGTRSTASPLTYSTTEVNEFNSNDSIHMLHRSTDGDESSDDVIIQPSDVDDSYATILNEDDDDGQDENNSTIFAITFTGTSDKPETSEYRSCRGNFFALYFVPNLLHFLAYLSMFHLMRTPESEKLETLMERGFLQTTRTTGWILAHKRLVNSLRSFLWMCMAWFTLSIIIHGLIIASRLVTQDFILLWHVHFAYQWPHICLTVLTVIGLTFNDLICAAIVTSYTVHAQLNISYIVNLCASIRERRIEFQEFYKRIEESRKFIDYLNNDQALGLSFLQITVGCKLSVGVFALLASSEFNHWTYLTVAIVLLSLFFWFTLFMVPLVQAVRLTSVCSDLKKIGHELRARPFGYQDVSQSDLDSLLLYTTNLNMNARVIRIPVKSSCILIICILFLVVILMFGQLGLLNV